MNLVPFFRRIWGDGPGWAAVAYKHPQGPWVDRKFRYPENLREMLTFYEEHRKSACSYFCVHLLDAENREKEHALPVHVLWADHDNIRAPELVEPKPTICWQTSPGRCQMLWLLSEPVAPRQAEVVNRDLTSHVKADKGGWALGKMLRFPGSTNFKYSPPTEGFLLWDDGLTYSFEQLKQLKPQGSAEIIKLVRASDFVPTTPVPETLPLVADILMRQGKKIPHKIWDMFTDTPILGEDWSGQLYAFEKILLEAGLTPAEVFVLAKTCPWNKYERDKDKRPNPENDLWREVCKAAKDVNPTTGDAKGVLTWIGLNKLLLHEEHPSWLVDKIWMARNVGFIAGVGKSYKSTLSLDLALSVASGKDFLDAFKVLDPGPVLMLQEEDPLWRMAHRMQTMALSKGITSIDFSIRPEDPNDAGKFYAPPMADVPLYASVGNGFTFGGSGAMERALEEAIQLHKPRLVILDPLFMLMPGCDEFKSSEVAGFLNTLKRWRAEYNCAVVLIHHYKKGSGDGRERLYGSMAFYAWSENSLFVSRRDDGSNIISVERDIKDALVPDKLVVEFVDTDNNYSFLLHGVEDRPVGLDKVEACLCTYAIGSMVPIAELAERTGLGKSPVRDALKKLEIAGRIRTENTGQGGKRFVIPLPALWGGKLIEVHGKIPGFEAG